MQDTNTVANTSRASEQSLVREPVDLHRTNLRSFIESLDGKIVAADYIKLGGVQRTLVGRLGVKSKLRGGVNKVERCDRSYLTMFDMQANGYRTLNLQTVKCLRARGNVFNIVG